MRTLGLGITNADLAQIPVGVLENHGEDYDGDGLPTPKRSLSAQK